MTDEIADNCKWFRDHSVPQNKQWYPGGGARAINNQYLQWKSCLNVGLSKQLKFSE